MTLETEQQDTCSNLHSRTANARLSVIAVVPVALAAAATSGAAITGLSPDCGQRGTASGDAVAPRLFATSQLNRA